MSAGLSQNKRSRSPTRCTIHVQTVFRDIREEQARTIAAEMIDRAHELANLPDFECDVDVSVQLGSSRDDDARAGQP